MMSGAQEITTSSENDASFEAIRCVFLSIFHSNCREVLVIDRRVAILASFNG